jgi:nitrous oxidase accessory protein NosD
VKLRAALLTLVLLALGAGTANAATLRVAKSGADTAGCGVTTPCLTIGKGVTEAKVGDVLEVGPGTYAENVTVSKEMTLRGAQAGVPRPGRNVPAAEETIVSAAGKVITVTASGAKIEGFDFVNAGSGGSGIYANPATKLFNLWVLDNQRVGGDGFLLNVANMESIVIEGNRVSGTSAPALLFSGETKATIVRNNEFVDGTSTAIQLSANKGMNREMTIVGNDLSGVARGLYLEGGAVGTAVEARDNSFADELFFGVLNASTQTFSLRRNWWGCNEGPNADGCSILSNTATGGTPPDASDWLVLTIAAEPASALPGGPVALHADLVGSVTSTRAHSFFNGMPVAFGTSLGTVTPSAALNGGRATATFSSPVAGTATVSADLDSQTATATLPVLAPTAPVVPATPAAATNPGGSTAKQAARPRLKIVRGTAPVAGEAAKVLVECVGDRGQNCGGILALRLRGAESKEGFEVRVGRRATIAVPFTAAMLSRYEAASKVPKKPKCAVTARTVQISGSPQITHRSVKLG